MEQLLRDLIDKFNRKVEQDQRLREELQGIVRKVQIDAGSQKYNFVLRNSCITDFSRGDISSPEIRLVTDETTLEGLLKGEIAPMKAIATRKVRISASLEDTLRLRKLF